MVLRHPSLNEGIHEQRGIPYRRETGLKMNGRHFLSVKGHGIIDLQILDFAQGLLHKRVIGIIPQALQCHDGIRHRGIYRSKPAGSIQPFQHPGGRLPQRSLPQHPHGHPVVEFKHHIQRDEEIMGGEPFLIFVERRILPIPDCLAWNRIELFDTLTARDSTNRSMGKHDQEWNQHRTRPIGDSIDAEVEFLRQQHDLDRHMRDAFPVILIEQCQRYLGEDICVHDPAHSEDPFLRANHEGFVRRNPAELECEVRFD